MRRRRNQNPLSLFSFQDIITSVTGILILLAILLAIAVIRQEDSQPVVAEGPSIEQVARQVESLEAELRQLRSIVAERDSQIATWSGRSLAELQTELESLLATEKQADAARQSAQRTAAESRQKMDQLKRDPQVVELQQRVDQAEETLATLNQELEKLQSGTQVVYNFRNTSSRPWLVEISQKQIRVGRAGEKSPPEEFRSVAQFESFANGLSAADRYFVLIVKPSGIAAHDAIRAKLESMQADIGTELLGEEQTALDPQTGAVFQ